jgi:hypothetical protein
MKPTTWKNKYVLMYNVVTYYEWAVSAKHIASTITHALTLVQWTGTDWPGRIIHSLQYANAYIRITLKIK